MRFRGGGGGAVAPVGGVGVEGGVRWRWVRDRGGWGGGGVRVEGWEWGSSGRDVKERRDGLSASDYIINISVL